MSQVDEHPLPEHPEPLTTEEAIRQTAQWLRGVDRLQDVTLELAARQAYVSQFHFCRQFRRVLGTNFKKYLNDLRMERAQELLRTTAFPITKVATLAGFNDLSYFERVFRRHCGERPSEYRVRVGRPVA